MIDLKRYLSSWLIIILTLKIHYVKVEHRSELLSDLTVYMNNTTGVL